MTWGLAGIAIGSAIAAAGLCPIVKRIWTPSWTIFSAGAVAVVLAVFYAVIDWRGWRRWSFPLVVAGMNSITLYCLWQLTGDSSRRTSGAMSAGMSSRFWGRTSRQCSSGARSWWFCG